jgi:hypothetical protein
MDLVVVYKEKTKGKEKLTLFEDTDIDDLLNINKRKPLLSYDYEILYIGVGLSLQDRAKNIYEIK